MFRSRVLAADAERDSAAAALAEHYAAGRLLLPELEARVARVYRARTRAEVARSFARLPGAGERYRAVAFDLVRGTAVVALRITWFALRRVAWPVVRVGVRTVRGASARWRPGRGELRLGP